MTATTDSVQRLYIAYFGRPADPVGLQYWTNQLSTNKETIQSIANNFALSPEYSSNFTGFTASQIVTAIYQNLFGRQPDTAGLFYWAGELTAGTQSIGKIALTIATAARNDAAAGTFDATTLTAKIQASQNFTDAVADSVEEINGYSGSTANALARAYVASVVDATTLTAATANLAATVANVVAHGGTPGQSFALTTGVDTLIGTGGNDTFTATDTTLSGLDSINGSGGNDTLTINNAAGDLSSGIGGNVTISGIENVVINSAVDAIALNAGNFTGLNTVTVSQIGVAADITVNTSGNATTGTVSGGAKVTFDDKATTSTLKTVSVSGNTGLVAVTSDALTSLSLANSSAGATVNAAGGTRALSVSVNGVSGGTVKDITATSVSLSATGSSSTVTTLAVDAAKSVTLGGSAELTLSTLDAKADTALTVSGSALTTIGAFSTTNKLAGVTITGSGGLSADLSGQTVLTAVDASGSSGANTITLDGGTATYTGGSGVDTVTLAAVPTKTIDGGAGTADEVVLNVASYAGSSKVVNFEVLGAGTKGAFDATGFTGLHIGNTVTGTVTFSNVAAGTTLAIDIAPTQDVSYVLKDATGKADAVSLTVGTSDAGGLDFSGKNITVSGIETITLSSLGDGTGTNKVALVDTAATSLTITGGEATTVTLSGASKLATVDASAVTKAVDLSGVDVAATGATIKGSATAGSILAGGNGADTLIGGAGNDTFSSGTGLDIITTGGGTATDTVNIAINTNGNTYATITDAHKGLILSTADLGVETFATTKITLAGTAVFQDYLDAATAANTAVGAYAWFQFGGDTYLVEDRSAAATFQNNADIVIKLTGVVDLSTATVDNHIITLG